MNVTRVTEQNYGVVRPPTSTEYNMYCKSITDNTQFFNNYWTIDVCGDFSNIKQDLDAISVALTQVWYKKINGKCAK